MALKMMSMLNKTEIKIYPIRFDEDDAYNDDYKNIALMSIAEVTRLDPDVMAHITEPVGTALIRVSADTLEIDHNDKPIFCQKRES